MHLAMLRSDMQNKLFIHTSGPLGSKALVMNVITLGECSALWASVSEAPCMVGVYVSSHRKLIGHIGCCRSPQLLAFSAGRAHTG